MFLRAVNAIDTLSTCIVMSADNEVYIWQWMCCESQEGPFHFTLPTLMASGFPDNVSLQLMLVLMVKLQSSWPDKGCLLLG